ncbi:VWA domain-containing protein [Nonomuraea sp. KC401]|uniref:VWA domain-containing protein n=1 Tax=unclassified Nonomuraea TaxID=2593643 RepID=UPI0010FEEE0E|nr:MULTISPECIES: VWA domain-containing protein [unclassified Nonomuraea]NBE99942.1 VWA domain-containing protein [Nonomuraea sp. K271]TLF56437.1 VWA domain-containing protein [Nonomuraea sp. KC401]
MTDTLENADMTRRQVLYWRLLSRLFGPDEQPALETAGMAIVEDLGLPPALLDPGVSVDTLVQRFPELGDELRDLMADKEHEQGSEVRRAALVSKLLLNVFATGSGNVTAARLESWKNDAGWFEKGMGCEPGGLRHRAGDEELAAVLAGIEGDLVKRMHLREVLADPVLSKQLTPSMSLIEQLLHDKHNLSGVALANAKALIRRFVDEVAEVLRTQVEKASVGEIDRSVPPKRVFRNLDVERTIWKNLTNWSPEDQRLYVDRLYYKQTARRTTPARLIVVVDQSGSMVDAMVNCTILASIFAGLPKVDVHLVAYDTRALDLTPWVHDPFEVLLRTTLGGGTDGTAAMALARPKISDPRNTVMVWISDFYDNRSLITDFQAVHRSGVKFIPVGSVNSSGSQSVDPWYRQKLKDLGTPVLSGHIRKLVSELKNFLT